MSREQENNIETVEKGMEQTGPSGTQAKFNDILEKAKADGQAQAEQWGEAGKSPIDTNARLQQWEKEIEEEKQLVIPFLKNSFTFTLF